MDYKSAWVTKQGCDPLRIVGVTYVLPADGDDHACFRVEDKNGLTQLVDMRQMDKEYSVKPRKSKEGGWL